MQGSAVIHEREISKLLDAIFLDVKADVFEAYSAFDEQIKCFDNSDDLRRYTETKLATPKESPHFAIRYEDSGSPAQITKVTLDPLRCRGHTFRYSADGWGLITLQLEAGQLPFVHCRIVVNTEKRALTWYATYPEWGHPDDWNWKLVEKQARRLIRVLKKLGDRSSDVKEY